MKIKATIFTLCLSLGLSVALHAQGADRLSISETNVPLSQVISEIESRTDYTFFINDGMIDVNSRVSLSVDNATVREALDKLFASMPYTYVISGEQIVVSRREDARNASGPSAQQQSPQRSVTGEVVDPQGTPIIGAMVLVEGTPTAVITDNNGRFSLNVAPGAVLSVSFMGFLPQRVTVGSQTSLRITLEEDLQNIEQVVVVGYGTQRRVTITGAVVSASGEDLARVPSASVTNTLIGKLPGLIANNTNGQPGHDDAELLIRGRTTSGDASPLIVVDGVADRAGGFARIDPNDIESISILKDASGAIYGSRAANGVILITTKRGTEGVTRVQYTSNYGMRRPTVLPKMVNSAEYAELLNEIRVGIENQAPMYSDAEIQKFRDGSDPINYPNVNAMETMLKDWSFQTQQNVSLSGGNDKVNYFVSLGYQFSDDYFKDSNSNYDQYNLRSNIDIRPVKNLRFAVNLAARQENRQRQIIGTDYIWRYLTKYDPRALIYWPGTDLPAPTVQDNFGAGTAVNDAMGYNRNGRTFFNADLTGHFDMPFITPGLSLSGGLYIDREDQFTKIFDKAFYTYVLENDGTYTQRHNGPAEATLSQTMNQTLGITLNGRINYERSFGDHNVNAFVAYEQYDHRYDTMNAYRSGFIGTSLDQLLAGDPNTQTNGGSASNEARQNYFGRVDYNFAEKYLLQFNFRYDGSENFPKGKRFGFFPGVSAGWRISEENFWKEHVPGIGYLKLRASWGQMGNDRVNAFQYIETYSMGNNGVFGSGSPRQYSGLGAGSVINPNITWEVAESYNFGLDMQFLKDFNLEFDIFMNKRSKILMGRGAAVPQYTGLSLPNENIGKTQSKGFELTVGYNKRLNDWRLSASANMSFARSKWVYRTEAADTPEWQRQTGMPIDANWLMYESIGVFHNQQELDAYPHLGTAGVGDLKFLDRNGDGAITGTDRVRQRKANSPEVVFGINLGATWKNWSLNALLQGATRVWQYTFWEAGTIGTFTKDFYDNRWTEANPNVDYPRVYNRQVTSTGEMSTFWLQNATYLRLKNIELSYSLGERALRSLPFKGMKVYVSGFNLLTFTGLKDHDPETRAGGQNFAAWNTPQTKVVNFGLQLNF